MMRQDQNPSGDRGRAIVTLVNWLLADEPTDDLSLVQAADALDLDAIDIKILCEGLRVPVSTLIPHLGRVS